MVDPLELEKDLRPVLALDDVVGDDLFDLALATGLLMAVSPIPTMVTPSGTVVLYPIDAPPIDGAPGPIDAITTTLGYNPPVILKAPDLKRKTGRTWSGPCERSMPLLLSR